MNEDDVVFPVSKTGLHCSDTAIAVSMVLGYVFPVSKTGLHCSGSIVSGSTATP